MTKLKKKIYSIDGQQAYKTKLIEDFNLNYVPGGNHSHERTVVLESGQSLSDFREIKKSTFGNPGLYVTAIYTRYSKLVKASGIIAAIIVFSLVVLSLIKLLDRRRQWRMNHIAGQNSRTNQQGGPTNSAKFDLSIKDFVFDNRKALVGLLTLIIIVFFSYGYVISSFTVDGISMDPTLQDRNVHPLLTLPVTIGRISGAGYVPPRGEIVVVNKTENNLFQSEVVEKSYVVKRIVALPGERVVISGGVITVYNQENTNGFVPDEMFAWIRDTTGSEFFRSDVVLKENELFVVGDNRDDSIDSRFYGPITTDKIVGKVIN